MATTSADSENPLLARLQDLVRETDFEFVLELIDIYLNETPKQIQTMMAAINEKNLASLTIAAHTLKGSSLNLGAKQLGALCFKLEELGRSGQPVPVGTNTKEIETEFELVKTMLLNFKQNRQ
jgi:HPt (histidine-containing phosphotransfer) domain-containing protein